MWCACKLTTHPLNCSPAYLGPVSFSQPCSFLPLIYWVGKFGRQVWTQEKGGGGGGGGELRPAGSRSWVSERGRRVHLLKGRRRLKRPRPIRAACLLPLLRVSTTCCTRHPAQRVGLSGERRRYRWVRGRGFYSLLIPILRRYYTAFTATGWQSVAWEPARETESLYSGWSVVANWLTVRVLRLLLCRKRLELKKEATVVGRNFTLLSSVEGSSLFLLRFRLDVYFCTCA